MAKEDVEVVRIRWKYRIKALAISGIIIMATVAMAQGHNSAVLVGAMTSVAALAGVKILNKKREGPQ